MTRTLQLILLMVFVSLTYSRETSKTNSSSKRGWKDNLGLENDLTKGLSCQTIDGYFICNGTDEQYQNATSQFETEARKLKNDIGTVNTSISRSGYVPCSAGLNPACTLLETVMVPTFLTNLYGQPRYVYQNRHAGILQEVQFTACRKGPCNGRSGKCISNERQYVLLSIDPYHPGGVFPDTFAVPGCCSCAAVRPVRPHYGHGYGGKPGFGYGGSPGYGPNPGYGPSPGYGKPEYGKPEYGYGKPEYGERPDYGPSYGKPVGGGGLYGGGEGGGEGGGHYGPSGYRPSESYGTGYGADEYGDEDGHKGYGIKDQMESFAAGRNGRKPYLQSMHESRKFDDEVSSTVRSDTSRV